MVDSKKNNVAIKGQIEIKWSRGQRDRGVDTERQRDKDTNIKVRCNPKDKRDREGR
jgi:hypothetical protein